MSRALNPTEQRSVSQALAYLQKLIDCYKTLPAKHQIADQLAAIEAVLAELNSLMSSGKIDIEIQQPG